MRAMGYQCDDVVESWRFRGVRDDVLDGRVHYCRRTD